MAHYCFLDENNVVTEVIPGKEPGVDGIDWEIWYGEFRGQVCKQTSYNTRGGIHYSPITGEPDSGIPLRKNYAGIGYTYDEERDAFYTPQPYLSWTLNEDTCIWEPPVPYPSDEKRYDWNEETTSWVED